LVKAYSDAVSAVCHAASFLPYQKLEQQTLTVSHKELLALLYQLKMYDIDVLNKKFNTDVVLTVEATSEQFVAFSKSYK
jgi:putative IMPACT (imprinted ancient) family translation regulator